MTIAQARADGVLQAYIRGWRELVAVTVKRSGSSYYYAEAGAITVSGFFSQHAGIDKTPERAIHCALDCMEVPK